MAPTGKGAAVSLARDYAVCPSCGEMCGPTIDQRTEVVICADPWHWREAQRRGIAEVLGGWE